MKRAFVVIFGITAGLGVVLSCLPELTLDHVGPLCGNGLIEYDAGEECEATSTDSTSCVDCKVQCPDGAYLDPATKHCYFVPNFRVDSIVRAQAACRGGANLVHLGSEAEHRALLSNLRVPVPVPVADSGFDGAFQEGGIPLNRFYVALQEVVAGKISRWEPLVAGLPGWALGCRPCYDGPGAGTSRLLTAIDAGACSTQHCAMTSGGAAGPAFLEAGALFPEDCLIEGGVSVVCERAPEGNHVTSCDAGRCFSLAPTHTKKHYALLRKEVKATEALAACSEVGAEPVVIESISEREDLVQAVSELGVEMVKIWIGLEKRGATWVWFDGVVEDSDYKLRPPIFADLNEKNGATEGDRAQMLVATGQPLVDNGLAHARGGDETASVVCQFRYAK